MIVRTDSPARPTEPETNDSQPLDERRATSDERRVSNERRATKRNEQGSMKQSRSSVMTVLALTAVLAAETFGGDWPFWRGPDQTGFAREKAAVTTWSLEGENLLWKSPVGGRTTPLVMGGRVYVNVPVGEGECLREALVCLDAATGATLWEHAFNVFHTDIVENRVGWAAPVADPETGLVYVHGTGGELICLDSNGEERWTISLTEMFGRISGYGGRLHTPIVDEDRVIITFSNSGWGDQSKPLHRLLALDKMSGEPMWWAAPGGDPNDPTCYATPVVAVIGGRRLLIAPNGDGHIYGLDARTGERVWNFQLSKRGLNSTPVVEGNRVYVGHSEENLHTTQMGGVVCIDGSKTGDLTQSGLLWRVDGLELGYSSPAIANGRLYAVDNGANLFALDALTGQQIWEFDIGRVGKASPVVTSDGVIYVADQTGVFHILRDAGTECVSLDRQEFTRSDDSIDEIYGSAAVVDGRVYFQTRYATYCLGQPAAAVQREPAPPGPPEDPAAATARRLLRITPVEVTVASDRDRPFYAELIEGQKITLDPEGLEWSLAGIAGTIAPDGVFKAAAGPGHRGRRGGPGLFGRARRGQARRPGGPGPRALHAAPADRGRLRGAG
jgi:outer membrane protein assembly factor BamB